ncbi:MAG TPA: tetratricopeptide repeat protein, partial [Labilithrix sp.]|nr:tetratricopeptide repeat protein [Labilithrix sp.]
MNRKTFWSGWIFAMALGGCAATPEPASAPPASSPEPSSSATAQPDTELANTKGPTSDTKGPTRATVGPQLTAEENAALDTRRARRNPRARSLLETEISALERLLAHSEKSSRDRPALLRRLAETYAELEASVLREKTQDARGEAVMSAARKKAILHYRTIIDEYPSYPHRDEVVYYSAVAYASAGDFKNARTSFYQLIKEHPSSSL